MVIRGISAVIHWPSNYIAFIELVKATNNGDRLDSVIAKAIEDIQSIRSSSEIVAIIPVPQDTYSRSDDLLFSGYLVILPRPRR